MLFHTLYLTAIVAEAMSSALMGMHRGMDRFGLCLVGTVTALGGGTLRDVLLGHYPLAWISHPDYVLITITATASAAARARWLRHLQSLFVSVDALGLIALTIIGCTFAGSLRSSPPPIRAAHINPAHAHPRAPPIKEHVRTLSINRPGLAGQASVATRPYSHS
jgi:uncharacterized membrane protein YeiH